MDMVDYLLSNEGATVLVVEDDLAMLVALRDILENAGFEVKTATHGQAALDFLREKQPSLILSDISMPVMDGFQLFEAVRRQPGGTAIPFIFLTARGTREDIFTGRSLGADDYITKPVSSKELLTAVRARLKRSDELMVEQLKAAYKASMLALAQAIEARDHYTHKHVIRLNAYAQAMAGELGWDEARLETVEFGAILHDIGKLDVPVGILAKKEPLTDKEWEEMRRHPEYGVHMIEKIDYLAPALPIVLYHHECWDGTGYPDGLRGQAIPIEARLLAVVDSFDAMTTDRPYRSAITGRRAYDEILKRSGAQFDPSMVEVFVDCWEKGIIKQIMNNLQDPIEEETEVEFGDQIED